MQKYKEYIYVDIALGDLFFKTQRKNNRYNKKREHIKTIHKSFASSVV